MKRYRTFRSAGFLLMVRTLRRLLGGTHPAVIAVLTVLATIPVAFSAPKTYPDRWVYVSRSLTEDAHVDDIRRIVDTAADHGLNGLVMDGGYYRLERGDADYVRRLAAVKKICERRRVEIIPLFFSAGYGGAVLAVDRNLAAGILVRDAVYQARGSQAQLAADPAAHIENGSFEAYQGQRIAGVRFHDQPGEISFVDTRTVKGGRAAVRFEQFTRNEHG
ncbi:MAG: hypothetical protein JW810_00490, partial [Sedimentisphaerales bacterium]|nr:hypothetical protein [Sedimentisphaerales bacterium]